MKKFALLIGLPALALAFALTAHAARVPTKASEVARPGGRLPGKPKLVLIRVADGFNDPVNVSSARDGTGRMFVVERVGRIKIVTKKGKVLRKPFLDLTKLTLLGSEVQTGFVEQGLWSVAFHPDFKQNGYFYIHYSSLPFNGAAMVVRMTVDRNSPNVVSVKQAAKTAKVIMMVPYPYYNHYGGDIKFGPDGYLYIGRGDGGWEGDVLDAGQDLKSYLAKMLRIDVNVSDEDLNPYRIPKSNPYARAVQDRMMVLFGVTEEGFSKIKIGAKPEIWAYGLRNPYKFHFDPKSGDLWISDVGQNHLEEIDWQPANSKGGENYGWKFNMGTNCHPMTGANDECPQVGVLPVAEYPHETPYPGAAKLKSGFGCAVMGFGVAHYGGLNGAYVVGDWCTGRVWAIGWDGSSWQMQQLMQANLMFTGGNPDEDGTLLATNCYCFYTDDKGALANKKGALWRFVAANKVPRGAKRARVRK